MPASNKEKIQQYIKQIYCCNMFNKMEILKWECKDDAKKTWALANTYFKNLFTVNRPSKTIWAQGRAASKARTTLGNQRAKNYHSMAGDLAAAPLAACPAQPSLGGGLGGQSVQGVVQRVEAWTKYVEAFEDFLTESKEFMASIISNQDILTRERM